MAENLEVSLATVLQKELNAKNPPLKMTLNGNDPALSGGYSSTLLKITVSWSPEDQRNPSSFVLKVCSAEKANRAYRKTVGGDPEKATLLETVRKNCFNDLHIAECLAYRLIKNHIIDIAIPMIYHLESGSSQNPGIILMQDLTDSGFVAKVFDEISLEKTFEVVDQVARLQAAFLNQPEIRKESQKWKFPTKAYDLFLDLSDVALRNLEKYSDIFDFSAEQLKKVVNKGALSEAENQGDCLYSLVHGDLWINNILWSRTNPDKIAGILDWQSFHVGPVLRDLMR